MTFLKPLLFSLALAGISAAQDSRPTSRAAESRPGASIWLVGASGDARGAFGTEERIYRIDAKTLRVVASFPIEGGPVECRLTPDGEELIVATSLRGAAKLTSAFFGLDPATLRPTWARPAAMVGGFRGMRSEPLVADPTLPDGIALLHASSATGRTASIVRRGGAITHVPMPEHTTYFAFEQRRDGPSLIAVDSREGLWRVDVTTGKATRLLEKDDEWSPLGPVRAVVIAQSENRVVCFGRGSVCALVDLGTGAVTHRELPARGAESGVAFARRCERTGNYLVCSPDGVSSIGIGRRISVLDPGFREIMQIAIMGDRFVDAVFSADGTEWLGLTESGSLRIHDVAPMGEFRRSPEVIPLRQESLNCAAIAGWR
jgi:hypothetical protein